MNQTRSITGTYGCSLTPCTIFVYGLWYCCEGSQNVNRAPSEEVLIDGVDSELIEDTDHFHWKVEITSEEELKEAVEA